MKVRPCPASRISSRWVFAYSLPHGFAVFPPEIRLTTPIPYGWGVFQLDTYREFLAVVLELRDVWKQIPYDLFLRDSMKFRFCPAYRIASRWVFNSKTSIGNWSLLLRNQVKGSHPIRAYPLTGCVETDSIRSLFPAQN